MGCLYKQPTRVVQETGGCLFFQPAQATSSCAGSGLRKVRINRQLRSPIPFTVTLRRSRDACINQRIDSLPCPALFSMFPGRQVRGNQRRGRGFTKLQRSACAGSNYVWIMWGPAEGGAGAEWEVIEKGGNGGVGGSVIARAENNWPADGNRWTQITKDEITLFVSMSICGPNS